MIDQVPEDKPIELTESKDFITEVDEGNTIAQALETEVQKQLDIVEKQTDRKTTIDSITTLVPSTSLNTPARIAHEKELAERERLRRRVLGF